MQVLLELGSYMRAGLFRGFTVYGADFDFKFHFLPSISMSSPKGFCFHMNFESLLPRTLECWDVTDPKKKAIIRDAPGYARHLKTIFIAYCIMTILPLGVLVSKTPVAMIIQQWLSFWKEIYALNSDSVSQQWLSGLGVWFSLWVREVPGSNPGWALNFICKSYASLHFQIP